MRVADGHEARFAGERLVEVHGAAASYQKTVANAEVGDELQNVVRKLDHACSMVRGSAWEVGYLARHHSLLLWINCSMRMELCPTDSEGAWGFQPHEGKGQRGALWGWDFRQSGRKIRAAPCLHGSNSVA